MTITHPCLLFENIEDTSGYQHRTESPWSSWEAGIISSANAALSYNFTDPDWRIIYQADATRNLGLAYQITKDTTYAEKAKDALLNLDIGAAPYDVSKVWGLMGYAPAYDWVQPYLDSGNDTIIRDKLATLADQVYYDLNDGGTNMHYITFADHHGQAYPAMGVAGCVLSDYNNPNNLPLSSTPTDWVKVGTDYLFVNDLLHNWGIPLINAGFDYDGKHNLGTYKTYVLDEFLWWFQIYSHFTKKNIFEEYPMAKKTMVSELWESLPNRYGNDCVTYGNIKWSYHRGVMNLFDDDYKAHMLNHDDIIDGLNLLPYSTQKITANSRLLYLTYDDYSGIQRKNPQWTSHFNSDSQFQVFRNNWDEDSDWLSLITWYTFTHSGRDMAHHDQLSFEYYSKGDLLLADGGEPKHVGAGIETPLDVALLYGSYDVFHNTILIEDPRTPFNIATWSNSQARGMYKGDANSLVTPASIENSLQTSWMDILEATVDITDVLDSNYVSQSLSSPIDYKRAILYPDDDYFIIIDRLEGSETWIYRNLFRFTSLNITASTGSTESEVGHVNGYLTIGETPCDWLSLSYKSETETGINTSSIKWSTTNPYGNDVELHLFSVPSSEIRVTKHVTRIAGYNLESEVFLPLVYFRAAESANDLYRVTVLFSRYTNEGEKIPEKVPVTGNGNAVKVAFGNTVDLIYAGSGVSYFANLVTNADIVFYRKVGSQPPNITHIGGTYVHESDCPEPISLFTHSAKSCI